MAENPVIEISDIGGLPESFLTAAYPTYCVTKNTAGKTLSLGTGAGEVVPTGHYAICFRKKEVGIQFVALGTNTNTLSMRLRTIFPETEQQPVEWRSPE